MLKALELGQAPAAEIVPARQGTRHSAGKGWEHVPFFCGTCCGASILVTSVVVVVVT